MLNRVADALLRQPVTIVAIGTLRMSMWAHVPFSTRPLNEHSDYEIRDRKLYRHLLHDLDFKETAVKLQ